MNANTARGAQALVLWDIDHTLIENGGASKATYALAAQLLTGSRLSAPPVTEGRTDATIMADLLSRNGCDPSRYPLWRIGEALTEAGHRTKAQLAARGHALPGAADCLRRLAADPQKIQSTLTGNIEANARVKLQAFGLDPWIDFAVGGYGVWPDRPLLVPVAQHRAAARYGFEAGGGPTVLIGDTPADVDAARRGGARILAVATGAYSDAQLRAVGADAVVPDLTDADRFAHQLERLCTAGPVAARPPGTGSAPAGPGDGPPSLAVWAQTVAAHFLDVPDLRERRWVHVQAVAVKAERMAAVLGADRSLLVAAAWLHDIGYSPALARSGFHPLDAAEFLRTSGLEGPLPGLVARHTGAIHEAAERGLLPELALYPDDVSAVRDALWACDLTTGPGGEPVTLAERLQEITARYGPDHHVTRAITAARPDLEAAVTRTRGRLRRHGAVLAG